MGSWREQQIGLGVSRCPADADMDGCQKRELIDAARRESSRVFADSPEVHRVYAEQRNAERRNAR